MNTDRDQDGLGCIEVQGGRQSCGQQLASGAGNLPLTYTSPKKLCLPPTFRQINARARATTQWIRGANRNADCARLSWESADLHGERAAISSKS